MAWLRFSALHARQVCVTLGGFFHGSRGQKTPWKKNPAQHTLSQHTLVAWRTSDCEVCGVANVFTYCMTVLIWTYPFTAQTSTFELKE